MRKAVLVSGMLALIVFVLVSCASQPAPKPSAPASQPSAAPASSSLSSNVYEGAGENESLLKAMNGAKMDAVRKAVIEMIGADQERANGAKLAEILYNTSNPNAFVDNNAMETVRKDKVGDKYVYEIRIPVNRQAVESALRANGIQKGASKQESSQAAAQAAVKTDSPAAPVTSAAKEPDVPAKYEEVTAEEKNFMRKYVDTLTYMVYFNDQTKEDPFLMKSAVSMANSYLVSNGKTAVDYAEVEKLKKDQKVVYEEETGKEMSMIQWIAQKLNADVYIEIDAATEGESQGGNHYATAKVALKMFESSTGNLLGSVPYSSPRTFSRTSQKDAKSNALQSTLYKAMPVAVEQSKVLLGKAFERGIRYELVVQNTQDSRLMTRFRTKLRAKVKDLQVVNQSAEQTKYAVYLFGRIEDLEEIVVSVADSIPGLEGMEQKLMRGKSITFDSGLK